MSSNRLWLAVAFLAPALFVCSAVAQTRAEIMEILDRKVTEFNVPDPGKPASEIFDGLASTWNIPIIVDPRVSGDVSFRVYGTHVRGLLTAICSPKGWHYEIQGEDGAAYLAIMRFITRSYSIDYPQVDQSANSSASVSLSGGDTSGGMNGSNGAGYSPVQMTGQNGQNGSSSSGGSGASTVSLTATSKSDFWERLEAGAKRYVSPEEILDVNRFSGSATLTGSLQTHALVEDYITRTMRRVRRNASITVQAIRVELNKTYAMGVDLAALKAEIGDVAHIGGTFTSAAVGGVGYTANGTGTATGAGAGDFGTIGSAAIGGPTAQVVIGAGKVSSLITALSKRGRVVIADTSNASALNNQMALIQVTNDLPFSSKTNTTQYNPGGNPTTGIPPIATTNYGWQTVSFGNVLEVTPQISDTLVSTVVVAPSVTEYLGQVTAPDGSGSRPRTATRRYRSTYVLRNHESAIIGAFMEVTKGKTSDGVPIIERVPVLGNLFKTDREVDARSEFILLMTVDAEDGDVAAPTTVVFPVADQARRLGLSKDMVEQMQPVPIAQPVRATAAPVQPTKPAPRASSVEMIGAGGK